MFKIKYFLYALSPIIFKFIIDRLKISNYPILMLFSLIFIIFWTFVGTQFADTYFMPFTAIILGNLIFIIEIIIFIFIKETPLGIVYFFSKNAFIILYPLISRISFFITDTRSTDIIIQYSSVIILFFFFLIGYFKSYNSNRKNKYAFSKGLL